ncbi:hypothetical protein SAMN05444380_10858 [Thermophagus xiamenensis]|uniref:Uncharacterized protein n=1 Tax=Thermophagus xiamenensis TaxID=385682 RepID=A0A1I1YS34_9BACT|nr:hypothetical protein SAMN05444380_10858 [Thermophagus xiamenensis]
MKNRILLMVFGILFLLYSCEDDIDKTTISQDVLDVNE